MPEPQPSSAPPGRGGPPPAPPGTGEPHGRPDPSDPGPPIVVRLGGVPLGDLGNGRVDARLLTAVLLRGGEVAQRLARHGVDLGTLDAAFPGCGWPLRPPLSWSHQPDDPGDPAAVLPVALDAWDLGELGDRATDDAVLDAITARGGRVAAWLAGLGVG